MKVDIIIPNFNGSHLIEKNIESVILSHKPYTGRIIVVDDGSSVYDISKLEQLVKKHSQKITLIKHDYNKGFSSAINTGASHSTAEFISLLNSDVSPHENFLEGPLKKLASMPNLFAVGCMDQSHENGKIINRGRGVGIWKSGMLQHRRGEVDQEDTFWVSGGSCVIKRELFEKIGGMDEIYNPFYWEDIDLSYRAQKSGYKIIFDNSSVVDHYHEKGSIQTNFEEGDVNATAYRNQFIFIWKNISNFQLITNHLIYLPVVIVGALKRGDFSFFKGFFLAVVKLPAIINNRQKQRKFYKISDLEIIKNIS